MNNKRLNRLIDLIVFTIQRETVIAIRPQSIPDEGYLLVALDPRDDRVADVDVDEREVPPGVHEELLPYLEVSSKLLPTFRKQFQQIREY